MRRADQKTKTTFRKITIQRETVDEAVRNTGAGRPKPKTTFRKTTADSEKPSAKLLGNTGGEGRQKNETIFNEKKRHRRKTEQGRPKTKPNEHEQNRLREAVDETFGDTGEDENQKNRNGPSTKKPPPTKTVDKTGHDRPKAINQASTKTATAKAKLLTKLSTRLGGGSRERNGRQQKKKTSPTKKLHRTLGRVRDQ